MEFAAITPERLDDLAGLFGATAVTTRCHCTWFLLRDPERTAVWLAGGSRACFDRFTVEAPAPTGVRLHGGRAAERQARADAARAERLSRAWTPESRVIDCPLFETRQHRAPPLRSLRSAVRS